VPEAVARCPNLPVLAGSLATALLKAASGCASRVDAEFRPSGWLLEVLLELEDPEAFEAALADVLQKGVSNYSGFRVAPVTIGPTGDTAQLEKVAKELSVPLEKKEKKKEPLYERLSALGQALARRYRGRLLALLSSEWRLDVSAERVRVQEGRGSMRLPSLPRSASMYEMGRFFGLRDLKGGSATRALLDVRADAGWWLLSLTLPMTAAAHLEVADEERRLVFVFFEPAPRHRYRYQDLKALGKLLDSVEQFVGKAGYYVEDVELARLTLLAHATGTVSNPFACAGVPGALRVWGLRLAGQRFQEVFSEILQTGEVALLYQALRQRFGEDAQAVAKGCAKLGRVLQRLVKRFEAVSRELRLERFTTLYKLLLRSLVEPGYAAPADLLYELHRFLEVEEWRARFVGVVAGRLAEEEQISLEEAREEASGMLNRLSGLVRSVAGAG
jgi:hypothetical protein